MAPKGFEPLQLAPGVFKTPVSTLPPEGHLVLNFQGAFRKSGSEAEAELPNHPFIIAFLRSRNKGGDRTVGVG